MRFKLIIFICFPFILLGCDNHLFSQFFRNPHIVDMFSTKKIKSVEWSKFNVDVTALNRNQMIRLIFDGSEPENLTFSTEMIASDSAYDKDVFVSSKWPSFEIEIEIVATSNEGKKYQFRPKGQSTGILFFPESDIDLMGLKFTTIDIRSNVSLDNVNATWISYTSK